MEMLKNILFLDIETVPLTASFGELPGSLQDHWARKARTFRDIDPENADWSTLFHEKSGVFSEFAKVVCIGIGYLAEQEGQWKLRVKSLSGDDEKVLLNNFCETISRFAEKQPEMRFCGHNIREFDLPFLCRRMLINDMALPSCLQLSGKKPWEITHLDTLELWRFGDYKNYTSLALLAEVLGIPTPKDDIDGSMVGQVYWQEHDLGRIGRYCLKDVATTCRVFLKLRGIRDVVPEVVEV